MYLSDEDILWDEPLIAYIENFMTPRDCHRIIDYAEPLLITSMVSDEKRGDVIHHGRTSSEVFIPSGACEFQNGTHSHCLVIATGERKLVARAWQVICSGFGHNQIIPWHQGDSNCARCANGR